MSEYKLSESDIRLYVGSALRGMAGEKEARGMFDAWLAQHDAEVRAKALEDYADEGERLMIGAGQEKPADDEWDVAPRWHEIRRLREKAAQIREGKA